MPTKFYAAWKGRPLHGLGPSYVVESNDFQVVADSIAARARDMGRDVREYSVICRATGESVPDATAAAGCPDDLSQLHVPTPDERVNAAVNAAVKRLGGSNPKQAFGDSKPPLHLVPAAASHSIAVGLSEGRDKYGAWNWRQTKVEAMTYVGAMLRHLAAYVDGEDVDPDSATGKSHLDGVSASLAILLDAQAGGFLVDNRPPKGPGGKLMRQPVKRVTK